MIADILTAVVVLVGIGGTINLARWYDRRPQAPAPATPPPDDTALDDTAPGITYRAVAENLPRHVRESIELSMPCPHAADGGHLWTLDYAEVGRYGTSAYRIDRWWQCNLCGIATRRDPRPPDSFARRHVADLPDRFEIARMFTP